LQTVASQPCPQGKIEDQLIMNELPNLGQQSVNRHDRRELCALRRTSWLAPLFNRAHPN
jgi:hypothetical protein